MKRQNFTLTELAVVVLVILTLMAMILPGRGRARDCGGAESRCKSNLKQIGTTVATYFSDGIQTHLPVQMNSIINKGGPMGMDDFTCPSTKESYHWFTEPVRYTGSATAVLAGESKKHERVKFIFKVFQDGHVQ
jgi:type II secretory pathway pseudopilin PulG